MEELKQLGEKTWMLPGLTNIGLYLTEAGAWIIDTGISPEDGARVERALSSLGVQPAAILNTHGHSDHVGGNHYLQERFDCPAYAWRAEHAIACYTMLNPVMNYGGFPVAQLRNHPLFVAQESKVQSLKEELLPDGLELVHLPGHTPDMVGFTTSDGVTFLADAIVSDQTMAKSKFTFVYHVSAYLETLSRILQMNSRLYVPSHDVPTENISPIVSRNIANVYSNTSEILDICVSPHTTEELLAEFTTRNRLPMTMTRYVLMSTNMKAYLTWLNDTGSVKMLLEDNYLKWVRV